MAKLTSFMYGLILSVGLFGIMLAFLFNGAISYNKIIPSSDNKTLSALAEIQNLSSTINEQKTNALNEANSQRSIVSEFLDIVGFWFEKGWNTVKLMAKSVNLAGSYGALAMDSIKGTLGIAYAPLRFIVDNLIIISIIIGVLIAVLVKWEL